MRKNREGDAFPRNGLIHGSIDIYIPMFECIIFAFLAYKNLANERLLHLELYCIHMMQA